MQAAVKAIKPPAVKLEQVAANHTVAVMLQAQAAKVEAHQQTAAGAALDLDGCLMGNLAAHMAVNHMLHETAAMAEINLYVAVATQDSAAEAAADVMAAEAVADTRAAAAEAAAVDLIMADQIKVTPDQLDRMTAK